MNGAHGVGANAFITSSVLSVCSSIICCMNMSNFKTHLDVNSFRETDHTDQVVL